ncbi:MAG: hypothetical protein RLZZ283_49, partial [Candidatus Parcubacteria bacterium]
SMFFRMALLDALQYPARTIASVSTAGIRMLFIFTIYTYAYSYVGERIEMTLAAALASLATYQVMNALSFRKVFYRILRDIQRGDLEVALIKPYSYIGRLIVEHVGYVSANIVPSIFVALFAVYIFADMSSLSFGVQDAVWWVVLAVLGTAISGCMFVAASLPALWINDSEPFVFIIDKTVMLLGGAFLPVALMPSWFATVALYSPFGAAMFATYAFNANFLTQAPYLALAQLCWVLALTFFAWWLFSVGVRKIAVNGG